VTGLLGTERGITIVKPTSADDVKDALKLARRMHSEGAYAFLPFEPAKVLAGILACSTQADHFAALALRAGAVVGFLGGALTTYPFCSERLAHDLGFYVAPEARASTAAVRLLRAFRAWALERGAREVSLGVSTGGRHERIERFYTRMGFTKMGGVYRARIS
jgi:GNAT superfamily N-acetyltransferase